MEAMYQEYRDFLYHFFLKHVKNPAVAEDLAQDVFIKFWEKRDQTDDIRNMNAWLYRIARNHLIDHYRKLATEHTYQQSIWSYLDHHSNPILLNIYGNEMEEKINSLIGQLSPRQKEVYLLSREKDLSLEEIAGHLKISYNTAKNHLVSALQILREKLGKHTNTS